ncbi:MAG: hypothetical protein AAFN93_13830 [Bacteroidota bacterium]
MVPLIHLDFELRRDYIAEVLCINRDEPITVCGGSCFLSDQLERASDHQKDQDKTINRTLELSFFNATNQKFEFSHPYILKDTTYPALSSGGIPSLFIGEIFEPPRIA